MKDIDIIECHKILLDIAREFHRLCVDNKIPYYMLGGTMLGAVRHHGFIPWDDDMDFGIPRQYFAKFILKFNECLDGNYKINTSKNTPYLCSGMVKISDTRTIIKSNWTSERIAGNLGINIDIFPLDDVAANNHNHILYHIFTFTNKLNNYKRFDSNSRPILKRIVANLIKYIPFLNDKNTIRFNEWILNKMDTGRLYANHYGAWGMKEWVMKSVFGVPTLYKFEDTQFYGVENYDAYLKHLYNNYLELPPENKRHIHLVDVYWK